VSGWSFRRWNWTYLDAVINVDGLSLLYSFSLGMCDLLFRTPRLFPTRLCKDPYDDGNEDERKNGDDD
jgi:hypothetical protein